MDAPDDREGPPHDPEHARRSLEALRGFLRPYYLRGAVVLALTLVAVGLDIAPVHLLEQIFDRAVRPGDMGMLALLAGALGVVVVCREAANTALRWIFFDAAESFLRDMRSALHDRLLAQSLSFYRGRDVGEIASRVLNDLQALQRVLAVTVLSPFSNGLFIIGMLGYLFTLDWRLGLVVLAVLPIYALAQRPIMKGIRNTEWRMREDTDAVASELVETLQNIEEVQSSGIEPRQKARMALRLGVLKRSATWLHNLYGFVQSSSGLVSGLANLAVLGVGGYLAVAGEITPGALVAFVMAVAQLLRPVEDVMHLSAQLGGAKVLAERVGEFLLAVPDVEDRPDAKDPGRVRGAVHFSDVTFGYDPARPILRGFELDIAPGERVALVGPSGSGKSTVLHLLRRFYDVQSGAVTLDGDDVRALTVAGLRHNVATVNQRPALFHGTVRDNISLGVEAKEDAIERAARAAYLEPDLARLEGGLDFDVGPDGSRLSGGQRQRVAIARAILRDAPVLLLDEATSALDAHSQAAVQEALDALLSREPKKTCMVIAHRLSTVRSCDRVVVLEAGQVAESGTYDALMAAGGRFAALARTELDKEPS